MVHKKIFNTIYKSLCVFLIFLLLCISIPFIFLFILLRFLCKPLSVKIATIFPYTIWTLTSLIFNKTNYLQAQGIDKLEHESYLVVSNHVGSLDFMLINELSKHVNMLPHSKYVIKDSLKFFPVFYQLVYYAGFLLLQRNFEKDKFRIRDYLSLFKVNSIPAWIILYPEGTRLTPKKKENSLEYCRRNGFPCLENVLFPRYKGFKLITTELRNSYIKNIVDVTFWYSEKVLPPLWKFLFFSPSGYFRCDIRVVKIEEIEDCKEFIIDSFKRKDELIAKWNDEAKQKQKKE